MGILSTFPVRTTGTTSLYLNKHCGFPLTVATLCERDEVLKIATDIAGERDRWLHLVSFYVPGTKSA